MYCSSQSKQKQYRLRGVGRLEKSPRLLITYKHLDFQCGVTGTVENVLGLRFVLGLRECPIGERVEGLSFLTVFVLSVKGWARLDMRRWVAGVLMVSLNNR